MKIEKLSDLYHYFDQLVDGDVEFESGTSFQLQDIADVLFASSYIRGFIALEAAEFGGEQQLLSKALANNVSKKLAEARNELSPPDQQIVSNFWHHLQVHFIG